MSWTADTCGLRGEDATQTAMLKGMAEMVSDSNLMLERTWY